METVTVNGVNYGPIATISVGASPFSWTNPESVPVEVAVSGGTVTGIEASNDQLTWMTLGLLGGMFRLKPRSWIRVTYILAPTMLYTPC